MLNLPAFSFSARKQVFKNSRSPTGESINYDDSPHGLPTLIGSFIGTIINYRGSRLKYAEATGGANLNSKMGVSKRGGVGWGLGASSPNVSDIVTNDSGFEAATKVSANSDTETVEDAGKAAGEARGSAIKGYDQVANLSEPGADPALLASAPPPEKFDMSPLFVCR